MHLTNLLESIQDLDFQGWKFKSSTYLDAIFLDHLKWTLTCLHISYQDYQGSKQKLGTILEKSAIIMSNQKVLTIKFVILIQHVKNNHLQKDFAENDFQKEWFP